MEYRNHPIEEIQAVCEPLIAAGNKIYFKWTCGGCGERAVANDPNVVHHWMNHEEKANGSPCGYVTDVTETGGNYILVSKRDTRDFVSLAHEQEEPLMMSDGPDPDTKIINIHGTLAEEMLNDGVLDKDEEGNYSFKGIKATVAGISAKRAADWDNYYGYIWPKRSKATGQCSRCFKMVDDGEPTVLSLHEVRGERMIPICKACSIDEEFMKHVGNRIVPPWDWPVNLEWQEGPVVLEIEGDRVTWRFREILEAAVRVDQGQLDDPSVLAVIDAMGDRDQALNAMRELMKSDVWEPLRRNAKMPRST